MKVTYYGHSCFGLDLGDVRIIIDPFISPNELAKSIDVNTLRADFVLVSHAHGDHIADVETITRNSGATIVASYEVASHYGAKEFKYHPMNIGGQWDFGKWSVKAVNAVHSSVFPDGSNGGSPMGFIIKGAGRTVYYSGDTALHMDMQLIGSQYQLDAAFLCLGDNFTMGYQDALIASDLIKCEHIIGMHFDTFPYIKVNHEKVIQHFVEKGKKLVLPTIGESWDI